MNVDEITLNADAFPETFERARQGFVDVRIPCWSLYMYDGSTTVEYETGTSLFQFIRAYPSQEAAVAATKTQQVSASIEPWWFVVSEELAADGKRYNVDGRQVYEHEINCAICLRDGIFNIYLNTSWIPFVYAEHGYRHKLFLIFKGAVPAGLNEEEKTKKCIEWRVDL